MEETGAPIAEIVRYIRNQFVESKVSAAKGLVMDCVIVAQNRSCITYLDKGSYCMLYYSLSLVRNMMLVRNGIKPGSQYDAGAYVASVASSLVHNMTLERQ